MQHFYFSKGTMVLLLAASFALFATGLAIIFLQNPQDRIFRYILGGITVFVFGGGILYASLRLLSEAPALTVSQDGITDNSSLLKVGFIPWQDITGFELNSFRGQQFIAVVVETPQKYVARASFWQRAFMRFNGWGFDSPVQISLSSIDTKDTDLFGLLQQKLSEYKP